MAQRELSVRVLRQAAIEVSNNTVANLLQADLGGPRSVTDFARTLGRLGHPTAITMRCARVSPTFDLATLSPPSRQARNQVIAVDVPTSNRSAAARRDLPPSTARDHATAQILSIDLGHRCWAAGLQIQLEHVPIEPSLGLPDAGLR